MNTRLQQFLAAENITQSQFADTISVARASVSHILSGRNKPGWDFLSNMMKHYPDLNLEWLMTGTGKMYKSQIQRDMQAAGTTASQPDDTHGAAAVIPSMDEGDISDNLFSGMYSSADVPSPKLNPQTTAGQLNPQQTAQERHIPTRTATPSPDIAATKGQDSPASPIQVIDNQRKISKIVVFYDDNTFIEIR